MRAYQAQEPVGGRGREPETPVGGADPGSEQKAIIVRPAMPDGSVKPPQKFAVRSLGRVRNKLAANTAHELSLVLLLDVEISVREGNDRSELL